MMSKPIYTFEGIELHTAKREIQVGGVRKGISPRVFDTLVYLIQHRDQVVSKDQLVNDLWRDSIVTDSSITQAIRKVRAALEECGVDPSIIRTQHGHGYRFVGDVHTSDIEVVAAEERPGDFESISSAITHSRPIKIGAMVAILGGLLVTAANISEIISWFYPDETMGVLEQTRSTLKDTDAKVDELIILLRNQAARSGSTFDPASERTINEALRVIVESGDRRKAAALDKLIEGDIDAAGAAIVAVAQDQTGATEHAKQAAAESWREAGAVFYSSNIAESVRCYEAAYDLRPDDPINSRELAYSHIRAGQLEQASAKLQQTLKLQPAPGLRADALRGLGIVAKLQGEYSAAGDYFARSLAIAEQEHDSRQRILTLLQLGAIARAQGDNAVARDQFDSAVTTAEEIGNRHLLAESLNNLGIIMAVTDAFDQADEVLTRAYEIQIDRQDLAGQATTLGNLGANALRRGDADTAESYLIQSVALGEKLGWQRSIALDLINLGGIAQARGSHKDAADYLQRALDITTRIGLDEISPIILANLGEVARDLGRKTAACEYWAQALPLLDAMEHSAAEIVSASQRDLGCSEANSGD